MKRVKRWKPKEGEDYYFIYFGGGVQSRIHHNLYHSFFNQCNIRLREGNCFRTRKEAETKLREIKKLLRGNNG